LKTKVILASSLSVNNLGIIDKTQNNLKETSNIQIVKNQIQTNPNSINNNSNINLNIGSSIKSKSPAKISSDKLIFIKTQMKNEIANFTNYG
jgi:hypothetical protein